VTRQSGQHLLHYRLVEKIGQGGMGSVWRAQDSTLDRDAAIKILPDAFANDSELLSRFEREAKLLASLNHPNLAAVFGVHEAAGTRFFAMEFIPGEDLSELLKRGPVPMEEVVRIMGRIADALEAAHDKGVVHRDLKPANVRLTPDGRVKVLDFGLAKAAEAAGGDGTLTKTGVILGTVPYMSPEQARGQPVDARTDIWAFGCVLWECLTGVRPFPGETVSDQLVAILNNDPDWEKLPQATPPSIVRLLRRCMAKTPRERLHHIADARIELEEAGAEPVVLDDAVHEAPRRWPVVALLVVALVIAIVFAVTSGRNGPPPAREPALENARFTFLTDFPGDELDAAISPDGLFVAFLSDRDGKFEAYAGPIGAGEYSKLDTGTIDSPKFRAIRRFGFHGDGDRIWMGGHKSRRVTLIPLMGKKTKPWLSLDTIHVDWSHQRDRVLYSLGSGGDPVFVTDANGLNRVEVQLPTEEGYHQHFPTWSPSGEWIYVVRGRVTTGKTDLWRVRPDGSGLEQLTRGVREVAHPAPIDTHTVLFVAKESNGSGPWLWELDLDTRVQRRATSGVQIYTSLSASRDGRRLVAAVANPKVGLFTVPILSDRVATESDIKAHPLPALRALAPRIRGDQLYYLSSIGGGDGLWRYRDGKSEEIWKGSGGTQLEHPGAIAPDGKRVAIVVWEQTRARLFVINADGTDPRPLMDHVELAGAPCWSPDGAWVAVGGSKEGREGLFKVHVGDGRTEQIHPVEATNPVWSPDGSMIVFAGAQVGPLLRLHAVTPDGKQLEFPAIQVSIGGERVRFLPDGSGIVYLRGLDPDYQFRLLHLESGEDRPLTEFASSTTMRTFDITRDGKTIVFDRQRSNSDIILIERNVAK